MTSSSISKSRLAECPHCQGPLVEYALTRYPVVLNILFAISFIAFLSFFESLQGKVIPLTLWCGVQTVLGVFVIRGRIRAKKRVYRCVRCDATVR